MLEHFVYLVGLHIYENALFLTALHIQKISVTTERSNPLYM